MVRKECSEHQGEDVIYCSKCVDYLIGQAKQQGREEIIKRLNEINKEEESNISLSETILLIEEEFHS